MLYVRGIKFSKKFEFKKHRTLNLLLVDLDNRCDVSCCGGIDHTQYRVRFYCLLCFWGESSRRNRASDNLNETIHNLHYCTNSSVQFDIPSRKIQYHYQQDYQVFLDEEHFVVSQAAVRLLSPWPQNLMRTLL